MTPQSPGKFCASCEKIVVDFSKMKDHEIKQYFISYWDQKTCGRFLATQLDRPLKTSSRIFFTDGINKLNRISSVRIMLLFLTSVSVWISSCVKNTDVTTGECNTVDSDSTCTTPLINDTTVIIKDPNNKISPDPKEIMKMGEISPEQAEKLIEHKVIMGDVDILAESDTVRVNIPDKPNCAGQSTELLPENDIRLIKGKVMLVDTISQKIKKRK